MGAEHAVGQSQGGECDADGCRRAQAPGRSRRRHAASQPPFEGKTRSNRQENRHGKRLLISDERKREHGERHEEGQQQGDACRLPPERRAEPEAPGEQPPQDRERTESGRLPHELHDPHGHGIPRVVHAAEVRRNLRVRPIGCMTDGLRIPVRSDEKRRSSDRVAGRGEREGARGERQGECRAAKRRSLPADGERDRKDEAPEEQRGEAELAGEGKSRREARGERQGRGAPSQRAGGDPGEEAERDDQPRIRLAVVGELDRGRGSAEKQSGHECRQRAQPRFQAGEEHEKDGRDVEDGVE